MTRQPLHPGADPGPPLRVDRHLVEAGGRHQQVPGQRGLGPVPGGLHPDGAAVPAGEADRGGDVLRGADRDDGCRRHLDGEVPRRAQPGVLRILRSVQGAGQPLAQLGEGGARRREGPAVVGDVGAGGHGVLSCVRASGVMPGRRCRSPLEPQLEPT